MFQENCDMRDEINAIKRRYEQDQEKMRRQIKSLKEELDGEKLQIMLMTTEKENAIA